MPDIRFHGKPEDYLGKFAQYQDCRSRYLIFHGGAGSGKSHAAAQIILFRTMTQDANHRILLVRKVHKTIKKSQYQLIKDKVSRWGVSGLFEENKTDLTFRFKKYGNEIISAGLDDVEKIKSIERVTSIWIEEATELTEADFTQLDLRLRGDVGTYKQILLTFNPIDANHWLKKRFFDSPSDDCTIDHSTAKDNPWIDPQYLKILENLADQDSTLYNVYALGKWGVLEGLIYSNWQVCLDKWPDTFDETIYGLDFGFNNPTAMIEINYKDQNIYERELLFETEMTNGDLINRLPFIVQNRRAPIYADCAEPARIEELRREGWNVIESDKSVKDGIDACKRTKIFVHPESANDIKELKGYKWKVDKKGNTIDEPVKWMDHLQDARRYAHYTHTKNYTGSWSGISITKKR